MLCSSFGGGVHIVPRSWWEHCGSMVLVGAPAHVWTQLSRLQPPSYKCHGLIKAQRFPFTSFNSGPRCPAFWSSYNQTFVSFRAGLRLVFTGWKSLDCQFSRGVVVVWANCKAFQPLCPALSYPAPLHIALAAHISLKPSAKDTTPLSPPPKQLTVRILSSSANISVHPAHIMSECYGDDDDG